MDPLIIKKRIATTIFMLYVINSSFAQPCYKVKKSRTNFNFGLLKEGIHVDTNKIKVDGVYIVSYPCVQPMKCSDSVYSFYRFFKNGRVFMSNIYCSFPNKEELNDLEYGNYGYYKIDNDNLIVEARNSGGGGSFYYHDYFKIEENNLIFYAYKKRIKTFPKQKEIPATNGKKLKFYVYDLRISETFW